MYFFASSLLLLVASTIYASPVRIESRGHGVMGLLRKRTLSERFHDRRSRHIPEWSDPDEVREPIGYRAPLPVTIIKRVDLSTVEVPEHGLTAEKKIEAQRMLIHKEKVLLKVIDLFRGWEEKEEMQNGEKKTFFYIEMNKPGIPALTPDLFDEVKRKAIEETKVMLRRSFDIVLDEAHSENYKYWGIIPGKHILAGPILLRYAKTVPGSSPKPINHQHSDGELSDGEYSDGEYSD